jgi:hypothetical protein
MIRIIFEKALNLTSGQSLDIPIESKAHGMSFRTMFYRERKKFLERGMHTNLVIDSIKEVDGAWVATIKCHIPLIMTLHKEDGSEEKLSLDFGSPLIPEEEISEDIMEILKKHREKKEGEI